MIPPPPGSTRTRTLCPDTTLCRALGRRASGELSILRALLGGRIAFFGRHRDERREDGRVEIRVTAGARRYRKIHPRAAPDRSEEHTSELQSLMRISYAVFCLKKKINKHKYSSTTKRTHIK